MLSQRARGREFTPVVGPGVGLLMVCWFVDGLLVSCRLASCRTGCWFVHGLLVSCREFRLVGYEMAEGGENSTQTSVANCDLYFVVTITTIIF